MPITLKCPNCAKALRVRDELAGKRLKCPGCAATFFADAPIEAETVEPERDPQPRRRQSEEPQPRAARGPSRHEDDGDDRQPRARSRPAADPDEPIPGAYRRDAYDEDLDDLDDRRPRPRGKVRGGLLALAIAHIIIGSLFLICGGIMTAVLANMDPFESLKKAGDPFKREVAAKLEARFKANVPGYHAMIVGRFAAQTLLGAMLVAAGFGIFARAPWSRTLTLIYAAGAWIVEVASFAYNLFVALPGMKSAVKEVLLEVDPGGKSVPNLDATDLIVKGLIAAAIIVIYPTIAGICMLLPGIKRQFVRK